MTFSDRIEVMLLLRRLEYIINTEPASKNMKHRFLVPLFDKRQYEEVSTTKSFMDKYIHEIMMIELRRRSF